MAPDSRALVDALNTALDEGDLAPLTAALRQANLAVCGDDLLDWVLINATMTDYAGATLDVLCAAGLDMQALVDDGEGSDTRYRRVDRLLLAALGSGLTTPAVVGWLVSHGADVNRRHRGEPLLNVFLARGANLDLDVLDAVLAAGADVNAASAEDGATPLMRAAARDGDGRAEAIERLLARGADASVRDHRGRTASDLAAAVPAPRLLDRLAPGGGSTPATACAAHALTPGEWFVLEPVGERRAWRWVGPAADGPAAQQLIEARFGTSRTPIGPFASFELLARDHTGRGIDAHARRAAGSLAPGQLVVLTLNAQVPAYAPANDGDDRPRAVFVVSGVFRADDRPGAVACVRAQTGWSLTARLGALTMMADGWPEAAASVLLD